ncbi:hypothetical protein NPIL_1091 [Nephila pilipes]|uniref:Uncharacterized protein n=1 Tax=Nephila pilipes TaxID=299642 RepID=A0A8X6IXX2_NEPPI|nr:hypothetical protein NPIL_1091 [Nephila pilipes]
MGREDHRDLIYSAPKSIGGSEWGCHVPPSSGAGLVRSSMRMDPDAAVDSVERMLSCVKNPGLGAGKHMLQGRNCN